MQQDRFPLTLEHVRRFLATKQDTDEIGICYNAMHCLLSETLNWLYPEHAPWRVDIGAYSQVKGDACYEIGEPLTFLARVFDNSYAMSPGRDETVDKATLRAYLEWLPKEFRGQHVPFTMDDLFGEELPA